MSIKSDKWIRKMSLENNMISPFEDNQVSSKKISYGLSSYGYDIRVTDEYKIFTNINSAIVDPKKFEPNKKIIKWAKSKKANILITKDPKEAVSESNCVYTDKWISMSDKVNKKKKKKLLKPYQVNKKIMKLAKPNCIFFHCLPRAEEVTDEIMYDKKSFVWLQALNKIHIQKSIIQWCLNNN